MSSRRANLFLSVLVLLSLIIQPVSAAAAVPMATSRNSTATPAVPSPAGFLYRATVTLDNTHDLARLQAAGVLVLGSHDEATTPTALVLADAEQLAELARLGFRPRGADELRSLVDAQGPARQWLAKGWSRCWRKPTPSPRRGARGIAGAAAAPDAAATPHAPVRRAGTDAGADRSHGRQHQRGR